MKVFGGHTSLRKDKGFGANVVMAIVMSVLLAFLASPSAAEEERTYTIELQKTAGIAQQIHRVGDKKVLAEPHKVREGEHIWQILREKGLLGKGNLSILLSTLKELNSSLSNLDLIHPGEEILIPLKIVPIKGSITSEPKPAQVKATVVELKGMKLENYTVQPGDSIIKVVMAKYKIPPARLYTEYLQLVRKLNPNIKDFNRIYPGQKIRLPIYSPQVVRKAIKKQPPKRMAMLRKGNEAPNAHLKDLKSLILSIGEEWKDTGEHFIPLRSGGQIDLKASSFPLITFLSGQRVVLDAYNKLPEKVSRLIEQTWPNYNVVHLHKDDSLRKILGEIFQLAGYPRILGQGEALDVGGPIPVSVSGSWILVRSEKPLKNGFRIVVVVLRSNNGAEQIADPLKNFLENIIGVKVVIYPPELNTQGVAPPEVNEILPGNDTRELVKTVFRLTRHRYRENVEIPVMGDEKSDFNLVIKADLFLKVKGHDGIIDLSGFENDILSFLREHEFEVLQLAGRNDPEELIADTLAFLGVPFDRGLHSLTAGTGESPLQVQIKLQGVVFADAERNAIFATPISLPTSLKQFLAQKGFRIMPLSKW